jgi:hypothetical protein
MTRNISNTSTGPWGLILASSASCRWWGKLLISGWFGALSQRRISFPSGFCQWKLYRTASIAENANGAVRSSPHPCMIYDRLSHLIALKSSSFNIFSFSFSKSKVASGSPSKYLSKKPDVVHGAGISSKWLPGFDIIHQLEGITPLTTSNCSAS